MALRLPLGYYMSVRYARKPIYLPTAPSKLFRIPDHKLYSKDECDQIILLSRSYKDQMKSIMEFANTEFYLPTTKAGGLPSDFVAQEREEFSRVLQENNRENDRINELKQRAFGEELKKWENDLFERKQEVEEKFLEDNMKLDENLREQREKSPYITPENIDEIIEQAMKNPISYEFCIDLKGYKYSTDGSKQEVAQSQ